MNVPKLNNSWLLGGLVCLVVGGIWAFAEVHTGESVFKADGSFSTLAGFTVLALALERFCEAVLAPWWGTASASPVQAAAKNAEGTSAALDSPATRLVSTRQRLGTTQALALRTAAQKAKTSAAGADDATKSKAQATSDAADSAWVQTTQNRPTILLPAAAIATVLCAYLHLFLLHGIASAVNPGIPNSRIAFAVDAVISGLALAGGAKPFHDLTESIASSSAAKKAAAGSPGA